MGYSSNLKKQRKPIIDYIEQNLSKLNENISDDEVFEICDITLKVVELKFNMERKDSKMYNKYNKLILNDILPKRIFVLSYMKPEDYELDINEVKKSKSKDLKFIYLYALKHYMNIAQLYNLLNQNIMDSWITEEGKSKKKVLLSNKNEEIKKAKKNNKDIEKTLKEHIENVDKHIKEYYKDIKNKEFYKNLSNFMNEITLENNINKILEKENQRNFYSYHLSSLANDLKIIEQLYDYSKERLDLIEDYLKN